MLKNSEIFEIDNILDVKRYLTNLKAVVFDMDDTLYSEKEYVRSGYRQIAKLFPQVENAEQKLWKFFEEKKAAIDEFLKSEGVYSDEIKARCLNVYRCQEPEIHLYPGVKQMLQELKKEYRLGLITDGRPEGQRAKIKALQLDEVIDEIIVTDELGGIEYRKPNPEAFRQMVKRLDVEYKDMCYVGDNVSKDFCAPIKLGMRNIWFRNQDGLYSEKYNQVYLEKQK